MHGRVGRWISVGPMRRVLTLRLTLVLLIALAALAAAVIVVARLAEQSTAARAVDEAAASLEQQLRSVQGGWQSQADVLRAQIDFTHLLDQPDAAQRNALLSAYIATLGGEGIFTHAVLVARADDRVLWRHRTRSQDDLTPPAAGQPLGWVYSERDGTLYRAIAQRVLVAGEAARLWLFVPLDNALLADNIPLDVSAEVSWRDRVVLRYPTKPIGEAGAAGNADHPSRVLLWAGDTSGPRLTIRRYAAQTLNVLQALVTAAMAGAVVATLGWVVLARWLDRHARRLGSLQSATRAFKRTLKTDAAVMAGLDAAAAGSGAELRDLAADMRDMMCSLEAAQRQQLESQAALADLNAHLEARIEQRTHELAQARDSALAGTRAKEQFLANMSHELRTPLSGMLGSLELIDERALQPPQAELLDIVRSSGQALLGIINEVLDFSKLEAGRLDLVLAPLRPAELLDEVARLFRADATRKGLTLRCECEGLNAVPQVMGDAARLRQVLANLTGNAVKFTAQGGIVLRLACVGAPGRQAHLRFEVVDTGPGIAAADQRRIFESFEQASPVTQAPASGGTGLGLAISDRLVAAMGGRLAVTSEVGRGACFHFELHLEVVHPGALPAAASGPEATLAEHGAALTGTVLVVDDNVVNRIIATQMLQRLGVRVIECEDGFGALELLGTQPVDAVLMDCLMPGMDGYEATRRMRARETQSGAARLPIIALSANAMQRDVQRCLDAGMDAYLAKPFTLQQLRASLAPWLGKASGVAA